ncbi:hypothetical protein, partial [Megasphaera sp.]|uniref:hypothetical protein n=1 Tax=Megasphaera sp. TaxID=2023260 RepID=UPI0025C36F6F
IISCALKISNTGLNPWVHYNMLSKMGASKINGQFRTPRQIIKMMVAMANPQPTDIIVDIKTPRLIQFNYFSVDFAA